MKRLWELILFVIIIAILIEQFVAFITPLMPYFPLVVVFCQRYAKTTGIGTLVSLMLPFSIAFLGTWTVFLLIYWMLGMPLGLQAPYTYPG